jgi:WD40 repeat protein
MAGASRAQRVVTGTIHGEVRIWNLGANVLTSHVEPHRKRITQIIGAGCDVFTSDAEGRIAIWNTIDGRSLHMWEAHAAPISSLDISRQRDRLFSSGLDGLIRVWDLATGKVIEEIEWEGCIPEKICVLDENLILCFGDDGRIGRWNRLERYWTTDHPTSPYGGVVTGICSDEKRRWVAFVYAPGRKMWVGTGDGLVYSVNVWDVNERDVFGGKDYAGREHSPVPAISPDGNCIYAAQGHSVEALANSDGHLLGKFNHEDDVTYIAIDPSGLRLATATNGGLVRVWYESTRKPLADFGLDAVITAMAFTGKDSLCVGTETGDVLIFQVVE